MTQARSAKVLSVAFFQYTNSRVNSYSLLMRAIETIPSLTFEIPNEIAITFFCPVLASWRTGTSIR